MMKSFFNKTPSPHVVEKSQNVCRYKSIDESSLPESSCSSSISSDNEIRMPINNSNARNWFKYLKWYLILFSVFGLIIIIIICGVKYYKNSPIQYKTCIPDSKIPLNFKIEHNFKKISEHPVYDVIEKQDCGEGKNSLVAMFWNSSYDCAAVAVSKRLLIAPVHCVQNSNFTLKLGCKNADCKNASITLKNDDFRVEIPWIFDDFSMMHDIAFIKLNTSIEINDFVPACLPLKDEGNTDSIFLSTFHYKNSIDLRSPSKVNMSLVSNEDCIKFHTHEDTDCSNTAPITDYHMCAGVKLDNGNYKGTVSGQSGSPLYARFKSRNVLMGIASWGSYAENNHKPSAFVSIKPYLEKILDNLQEELEENL